MSERDRSVRAPDCKDSFTRGLSKSRYLMISLLITGKPHGRTNQGDVRKGLGEVACQPFRFCVVLL